MVSESRVTWARDETLEAQAAKWAHMPTPSKARHYARTLVDVLAGICSIIIVKILQHQRPWRRYTLYRVIFQFTIYHCKTGKHRCTVTVFQGGAMTMSAAAAAAAGVGGHHVSTSPSVAAGASCMYSYVNAYV